VRLKSAYSLSRNQNWVALQLTENKQKPELRSNEPHTGDLRRMDRKTAFVSIVDEQPACPFGAMIDGKWMPA